MYAPVLWLSGITWHGLERIEAILRREAAEYPELMNVANAAHAELTKRPAMDPNADLL